MITCCEIAITLAVTNLFSLAIFAGYTVHLRLRQMVLEKKNGAEQHQIEELKREVAELKQGGGRTKVLNEVLNPANGGDH